MSPSDPDEASSDDTRAVDLFLTAALRDETTLPTLPHPDLVPERALYHGVSALLASLPNVMAALPPQIQAALHQQALAETMWDLRHRQILVPLLDDLANADVAGVLLKGTALAYSSYPASSLRPRGDTDILVPASQKDTIYRILGFHGFSRELDSKVGAPTTVIRQESWSYTAADGSNHSLDLHWGIMNAWSLSHLFDSDRIRKEAQPLGRLTPSARMMSNLHAVYHACIHRAVHIQSPYYIQEQAFLGGDRLIWLYDIHLMLPKFTDADWADLLQLCRSQETADLCLNAFAEATQLLGSCVPSDILAALKAERQDGAPKLYLTNGSVRQKFASDLRALPTIIEKLYYLRYILFPSKAYIYAKYPEMSGKSAALLYMRRIIAAALRKRPGNSK
jgi:hypothetical protein